MSSPDTASAVLERHKVKQLGSGERTLFMVHGFGCNQAMWRFMVPHFEKQYRIVLFDHLGTAETGKQDWNPTEYNSLERYADDVCDVVHALDLQRVTFIGHSVSAIICGLAARKLGDRIEHVVMIGPSAHYLNDGDYRGGFERKDIDELLQTIEINYQGWSEAMAPAIMGRPDAPRYGEELTARFCEQEPEVAYHFAKATFLGDNRGDLATMATPALVLQCSEDIIAPEHVGQYVAEHLPHATFRQLEAKGHCPNLSAPEETAQAIKDYLAAASN